MLELYKTRLVIQVSWQDIALQNGIQIFTVRCHSLNRTQLIDVPVLGYLRPGFTLHRI